MNTSSTISIVDPIEHDKVFTKLTCEAWPGGRPLGPAGHFAAYNGWDDQTVAKLAFNLFLENEQEECADKDEFEANIGYLTTRWRDYCRGDVLSPGGMLEEWLAKVAPVDLMQRQYDWAICRDPESKQAEERWARLKVEALNDEIILLAESEPQPEPTSEQIPEQPKPTATATLPDQRWSREKCLKIVQAGIPLKTNPVVDAIKRGGEHGIFFLRLSDGREIRIGGAKELRRRDTMPTVVLDATGLNISTLKPAAHMALVQAVSWLSEEVDTGSDADETIAWIKGFLNDRCVCETNEDREALYEAIETGTEAFEMDGLIYVRLEKLRYYLRIFLGEHLSMRDLGERLSRTGAVRITVSARKGSATASIKAWKLSEIANFHLPYIEKNTLTAAKQQQH